jgi:hypothetical protein
MIRHILSTSFRVGLFATLVVFSHCPPPVHKTKGIVAFVYTDLTVSINDETAKREKENIGKLFQNLPAESQFYLFSIDRGTNKPSIYEFLPKLVDVKVASDQKLLAKQKIEIENLKQTTEFAKLKSSLDAYHSSISKDNGHVSCITNKLNSLADIIASTRSSYPDYDIRLYFYSDMIEDCQNSFDGKLLRFDRDSDDRKEVVHLQDIQNRIEKNFEPARPDNNLKSMGTKVYIILTSQDDKQTLKSLKTIWNNLFGKLGLAPEDIKWTIGNEPYFWTLQAPNPPTT